MQKMLILDYQLAFVKTDVDLKEGLYKHLEAELVRNKI